MNTNCSYESNPTFHEFCCSVEPRQHVSFTKLANGCLVVYCRNPQLWHLSDFVVSAAAEAVVFLVPRKWRDG